MRPQHNAAENFTDPCRSLCTSHASMRPQHNAAENGGYLANVKAKQQRFNEAAA